MSDEVSPTVGNIGSNEHWKMEGIRSYIITLSESQNFRDLYFDGTSNSVTGRLLKQECCITSTTQGEREMDRESTLTQLMDSNLIKEMLSRTVVLQQSISLFSHHVVKRVQLQTIDYMEGKSQLLLTLRADTEYGKDVLHIGEENTKESLQVNEVARCNAIERLESSRERFGSTGCPLSLQLSLEQHWQNRVNAVFARLK
ncbi:hypothetical protein Anapl_00870 [Anas platyrhynchos]|uniref:Uncharacterized protein n=1 Tax=Anas platyrhynchos TaxID=8839 RepID=R0LQS1_ANAPL|nr:hypothetical protein Anapl_00870 [Anas platyrhynchos]